MTELNQYIEDYREFKRNWDNYTHKERKILLNDFGERLYELNNKPIEL